jgi:hypothetical protein
MERRLLKMLTNTVVAILPAPKDEVFTYLANIGNLPQWATEFCQSLKVEKGKYKVHTCTGQDLVFKIEANATTGTIDMFAGPTEDQMGLFPTRVIPLQKSLTAYIFTMFQGPGMSEESFRQQAESLRRELDNIERHFSNRVSA